MKFFSNTAEEKDDDGHVHVLDKIGPDKTLTFCDVIANSRFGYVQLAGDLHVGEPLVPA